LWPYLPGTREESVHIALFPTAADLGTLRDPNLMEAWEKLMTLREQILARIEPLRKDKQIGSLLQARVVLSGTKDELAWLAPHARDLPMLFIASEVELTTSSEGSSGIHIEIERSRGVKCERCWRYVAAISTDPGCEGLC